jgi:hypothetical protein
MSPWLSESSQLDLETQGSVGVGWPARKERGGELGPGDDGPLRIGVAHCDEETDVRGRIGHSIRLLDVRQQ